MKILYVRLIYMAFFLIILASNQAPLQAQPSGMQFPDTPVYDVEIDDAGNIFVIAYNWVKKRPQLRSFTSDGKLREDFTMRLPNFCCDPFPLEMTFGQDGYIYVLFPGKKISVIGVDMQIVKLDKEGKQDDTFGINSALAFPPGFSMIDFDVTQQGTIWAINSFNELYRFDENNVLRKIRDIKEVFPDNIYGDRFEDMVPVRLLSIEDNRLLLIGAISVQEDRNVRAKYYCAWIFDEDGILVENHEWEAPWHMKAKSDDASFFSPLGKTRIIRKNWKTGSILGYQDGYRGQPDKRALSILDWTIVDGFHYYNIFPIQLPGEVYLTYDLAKVHFVKSDDKIILLYPFERDHKLLVVNYDQNGKILNKYNINVFR
jgi:hypothetical protein